MESQHFLGHSHCSVWRRGETTYGESTLPWSLSLLCVEEGRNNLWRVNTALVTRTALCGGGEQQPMESQHSLGQSHCSVWKRGATAYGESTLPWSLSLLCVEEGRNNLWRVNTSLVTLTALCRGGEKQPMESQHCLGHSHCSVWRRGETTYGESTLPWSLALLCVEEESNSLWRVNTALVNRTALCGRGEQQPMETRPQHLCSLLVNLSPQPSPAVRPC